MCSRLGACFWLGAIHKLCQPDFFYPVAPNSRNLRSFLQSKVLGPKLLLPMGCVKLGERNYVHLPSVGEQTVIFHLRQGRPEERPIPFIKMFCFLTLHHRVAWNRVKCCIFAATAIRLQVFCAKGGISTGPEIITSHGLRETGWKKLRSPAFCGWTNRKLLTQFHATHEK